MGRASGEVKPESKIERGIIMGYWKVKNWLVSSNENYHSFLALREQDGSDCLRETGNVCVLNKYGTICDPKSEEPLKIYKGGMIKGWGSMDCKESVYLWANVQVPKEFWDGFIEKVLSESTLIF